MEKLQGRQRERLARYLRKTGVTSRVDFSSAGRGHKKRLTSFCGLGQLVELKNAYRQIGAVTVLVFSPLFV